VISDEEGTGKAVFNTAPTIKQRVTTKTTTATLTVDEAGTVLVSASSDYTITLPTAVGNTGLTYHFKKTDANYNLITLDGDGTETFNYENADGVPKETYARLNTYCAEVTVVSDGSNWQVYDESLGQMPDAQVYLSENQLNLDNNTYNRIEFDSENYDIGSNYDISEWVSGSATATSANHLVDTTNNQFTSGMVGCRIKNTTDTTYAYITAYNSTSDVTLNTDIFINGENYEIKNSKFVCPVAGKYMIIYQMIVYNSTETDKRYTPAITVNGSRVTYNMLLAPFADTYLGNPLLYKLNASKDDAIDFHCFCATTDDTTDIWGGTSANTQVQIWLIEKE